jgi:SAM-dependent methyltransferase
MKAECPSCAGGATKIGVIHSSNRFAGQVMESLHPAASLYRCEVCHLSFRAPRLSKEAMDRLYARAGSDVWQSTPGERTDWQLVLSYLRENIQPGAILDIGCYDGAFLASVGAPWRKFGVEINKAASASARSKGIDVLGCDVADLGRITMQFDAVVAFDVVEHVDDPFALLSNMVKLCKTGGIVVLSSGDSDAPSWRFMGSAYWYCTIPEHVSFINRRWAADSARRLGLDVAVLRRFSHTGRAGWLSKFTDVVKNTLYKISPAAFALLRKQGFGGLDVRQYPELARFPPFWLTARDHVLIVLRKRS